MKTRLTVFIGLIFLYAGAKAQKSKSYALSSPDKKIAVSVWMGSEISWSVRHEQTAVLKASPILLALSNGDSLGLRPRIESFARQTVKEEIVSPVYKKSSVPNEYGKLVLKFRGGWSLEFRAYNDGVAYRFLLDRSDSVTIVNETSSFRFEKDHKAWFPYVRDFRVKGDPFSTSFESLYDETAISGFAKDTLAFLPVLVDLEQGKKAVLLESDLDDYPGMYVKGGADNSINAVFAPYPLREEIGGLNKFNMIVAQRAPYIARVAGKRSLPWRSIVISAADKELLNSDMVYKLAAPSRIADLAWIHPGKVAWDWWNDWNIKGVDFRAGINTQTYKYYIDFASANHIEYIIMDEGWSDIGDLFAISKSIDLQEIVNYGKQKNVGVILWATWRAVHAQMEKAFPHYAAMGIKGFKIDFLDRDDQKMVASTYFIAQKAAENHLLLDYHGMFKPGGLQRTWPNVLNFEGVKGLENVKWTPDDDMPHYDVSIPFIRMVAGPMDYTPGAMRNANKWNFRPVHSSPMSQGTRAHQLAMYVVFEAPLQMLCDNPTAYQKEQESTDFIAKIPTVFDNTVSLDGRVGAYVAIARKKGEDWFTGALTNWEGRQLSIDLAFLDDGVYEAEIFSDGVNADRDGTDYKRELVRVNNKIKLSVSLAPGGGWAARFHKIKE